jgi:C1A family cysteine protease
MKRQRYGWVRDIPDHRDFHFSSALRQPAVSVDLRSQFPPVYDQGELGSCTANAVAGLMQFDEEKEHAISATMPSRLFIYYQERVLEGTVGVDSGAQLRDGIKVVVKWGVCPETGWPYNIAEFALQPPPQAYTDAAKEKALVYLRMSQRLSQMRGCLAAGFPYVFGLSVYESFESQAVANTGIVPLPAPGETQVGGHAMCVAGYDDAQQWFIVRNSWGDQWGDGGYGYMPYAYLLDPDLAGDFWTVRRVT